MTGSTSPIFTIGHSTRTLDAFLELLRRERIEHLVDVRRYPASRRYPHFDSAPLARELIGAGIDYSHAPALGGRRRTHRMSPNVGWRNASFRGYADHMATADFQAALDDLIVIGQRVRTTIMCAEAVPWRCHRTLIADALAAREIDVRHILDAATNPHVLTRFGRVRNGLVEYPGEEGDDLFSASRSD
jgi:uncharacterized protein (DUF488 family)